MKIRLPAWKRMEKDGFLEEEVLCRSNDCNLTKGRLGAFVKGSRLGLVKMCVAGAKSPGLVGAACRMRAVGEEVG